MTDSLTDLKSHPKTLDLYGSRIRLIKRGHEYDALCPFHNERTPSFQLNQKEGKWLWHCKSGPNCGGGDILSFIQKLDSVEFKEAVKVVREFCSDFARDKSTVERVFKPVSQEAQSVKTYPEESFRAQEQALQNSPAALAFLKGRGIDARTAQRLRVGFRADVGRLAGDAAGDYSNTGWLAFPTFDSTKPTQSVTSIKYRSIAGKHFCKQPGMGTYLWNTSSIDGLAPVFLVEGEMDVLTLEQAGFPSVGLPNAQYKLTPEDKTLLLGADYIVLAGDNDEAGKRAMELIHRDLKDTKRVFYLKWPDKVKDANQMFLEECKQDVSVFRTRIEELVTKAKNNLVENVQRVGETIGTGASESLINHPLRLRFPWQDVDDMAVLLPGSVLAVSATNTKMGKTQFVLQSTMDAVRKGKEVVVNYQCELGFEEIDNILRSQILRKSRNEAFSKEDNEHARKMLTGIQYYVGYDPKLTTLPPVLKLLREAVQVYGATCVVLDHLHFLCESDGSKSTHQTEAEGMVAIKNFARDLEVKFIVVLQPRKANSQNKGKSIHISDLKGSEAIGSTADAIMVLHRKFIPNVDLDHPPKEMYEAETEVHLLGSRAKGRGFGAARLHFLGDIATFVGNNELARIDDPQERLL